MYPSSASRGERALRRPVSAPAEPGKIGGRNGWGSAALTWLHGFQLAPSTGRAGRHLPGNEAGLAHICLQMLQGLTKQWTQITLNHRASQQQNRWAFICQELSLQVCSALTPFPKISLLSHIRKILGEVDIVLTLCKPHTDCFISVIIFISRISSETSRAEEVTPHHFL